jgi:hypothetical protein
VKRIVAAVLMAGGALSACERPPVPHAAAESTLIHSPPLKHLDLKQLKALSQECEKYLPGQFARGPYDAAYCQEAIDRWGDAPLEMVRIAPSPPAAGR